MYTAKEKEIIQELLARFNARRVKRGRPRITAAELPQTEMPIDRLYLVDNYQVRRHWRRLPHHPWRGKPKQIRFKFGKSSLGRTKPA